MATKNCAAHQTTAIDELLAHPAQKYAKFTGCSNVVQLASIIGGDDFSSWLEEAIARGCVSVTGAQALLRLSQETQNMIGSINYFFYDINRKKLCVSCQFPASLLRIQNLKLAVPESFQLSLLQLNSLLLGEFWIGVQQEIRELQQILQYQNFLKTQALGRRQCDLSTAENVIQLKFIAPLHRPTSVDILRVFYTRAQLPHTFQLVGFVRMPIWQLHRTFTQLPSYPSQTRMLQAQLLVTLTIVLTESTLSRMFKSTNTFWGAECQLDDGCDVSAYTLQFDQHNCLRHVVKLRGHEFSLRFLDINVERRFCSMIKDAKRVATRLAERYHVQVPQSRDANTLGAQLEAIAVLFGAINRACNRVFLDDLGPM